MILYLLFMYSLEIWQENFLFLLNSLTMEFYDTKCFEYAYAKYLSFSKMVNGLTNALKMLRQEFNNSKNFE